ncbi:hypothetical protein KKB41_03770 [Patescibacteria group bacterium]|nr:hypothetical protein [Patescibacteria group bacterium]
MAKKTEKLELVQADENSSFWINNGPILKNIKDLADALKNMSEELFAYHVNAEKNDFAVWAENVLKDETLAKKIAKSKSLKAAAKAVGARLKKYNI